MAFKINLLPLRGLNYRLIAWSEIVNINCITPALSTLRISTREFSTNSILKVNKNSNNVPLFIPLQIKPLNNPDDINVGEELTGKLNKDRLLDILITFFRRPQVINISEENGLDYRLFSQAFVSFRRYCVESESLPPDLHVTFSDILQGAGNPDDLLPYFLNHAREIFPHLQCMEDLKKISDIRLPTNWYPEARAINRKIIFHAGPTNSGKTYHALERFMSAKSGVYCGPLKLLASEVFSKCNEAGTHCDLVTGEERRFANEDRTAANHVSCTVEMASVTTPYEVAVIDEIQMIRDIGRGWAWTRAFLGVAANEIHLCGEPAAIDLIKEICMQIGETVEIRKYKRLTQLAVQDRALESLNNVEPGDCIVCFSKNDIYKVSREIEKLNKNVAVIYGSLPPGTKLAQAKKFNDPNDQCKILVATDAIGMGLNLSIRRIIFYSLIKPTINEKGEKEMDTISTSQALQIAGRAGRYGSQYEEGFVTTFKKNDLAKLKTIMNGSIDDIEAAGLHPTAEQIEMFAFHLPHATLSNLIDIFVSLCEVDHSRYFMCNIDDFKFLADMIQHVPLPLRARYVFCCAPINRKVPFVCTMFLKFTRQYSKNELITLNWLCQNLSWPFALPQTIVELVHLEAVFDILDLYLWLSYRFQDFFPDAELVRAMQVELDEIIQLGVGNITTLLRNSGSSNTVTASNDDDDPFIMKHKMETYKKEIASSHVTDNLNDDDEESEINQQKYVRRKYKPSNNFGSIERGKLSKKLISEGLLTVDILKRLRREWENNKMENNVNDDSPTNYNNSNKKNK